MSSKTKLIFVLFLSLYTYLSIELTVYGQTNTLAKEESKNFIKKRIEFIIGPSLLYPLGNFNQENNPRQIMTGYSFGVGFKQFQSNGFEIISRLLYERKGYKTVYTNSDPIGNTSQVYNTQKLNYVSLSVLPALAIGNSKKAKLLTGAYFSLLTKDAFAQKVFLNGQYSFSYFANNVKGRFNTYDYGISLGASHTRTVNDSVDIGLQLLGNMGLNNIVPKDFSGVVIKPCSISLSIILTYKY